MALLPRTVVAPGAGHHGRVRLFRRRPDESAIGAAVSAALGQPVAYDRLQYHAGALSGTVDVADAAGFEVVLRTAYDALVELLGDDADRVVFYLTGSTPDAAPITARALGLPVPPSGHDLAQRFG
jgi:hypothetical protein